MFGEGRDESSPAYLATAVVDEEHNPDPDASDDVGEDQDEVFQQAQGGLLPVWLRESSRSFRWRWVPLPLRKAGRAVVRWVKGPVPPRELLLTPLWPRVQELPVRGLEKLAPKRRHKIALLLLLYVAWFSPWFSVVLHSRSSGYIEGYGRPQTLSCTSNLWGFDSRCGLNGNNCRPFSSATLPFRCPADCRDTKVLEPHMVGNVSYNYQPFVIGGPSPSSEGPAVYRADSFICQAAVHAGVISDVVGGCGVLKLEGAAHSYPSSKQHGILSVGFPSTFPKSYSFVDLQSSQATCPKDPRWEVLGVTVAALTLLWLFCTSPPVLFFSTFFILMAHVGLVSDPPSYPNLTDLVSTLLSRLLPASFVIYVLYKFCARPLLAPLSSPVYQLTKTFLYLPMAFIGALNNYTFAKLIPLQRLTPLDIQQQPGAKLALALVIPVIICIVLGQAWHIRVGGLMPRYLKIYCTMGLIILILLPLPGLRLRIHHYILGILLMPGTAFPTRPSLIYQGLLLGLFVNGVARWGFASIIETPASLGERVTGPTGPHGWWGATFPNITTASVQISLPDPHRSDDTFLGNGNITFALWEHQRMADLGVDGVTVLVNDVERYRGYLDEHKSGEFTWHRRGHRGLDLTQAPAPDMFPTSSSTDSIETEDEEPEDLFFRFAFLQGSQVGGYGGTGVWLKDGGWISPPPPK
ncbi:hypothetical protein ASPZODRAFT_13702 [Penicilliopsis zonata CBS 506.65]|uniref:LCCL domain-containing protein n=1 Tax=Penicilliopsis zonata CBS 506.65 TaxID=1073090 RepID=A0A1L9SPD3_9EURO|nr:hypothetical protein ASPZODRAFT_13702 [Penicilliopsis zonata CBS 506.65]OJJ48963.1 hypothetical protein ASPZODRAFT_13702 [Penicilliopsis zonata CBS 506.65]